MPTPASKRFHHGQRRRGGGGGFLVGGGGGHGHAPTCTRTPARRQPPHPVGAGPAGANIFTRNFYIPPIAFRPAGTNVRHSMIKPGSDWDIPSATSAYNIDRWGAGYFAINAQGNCQVTPLQNQGAAIDVMAVVQRSARAGAGLPAGHPLPGPAAPPRADDLQGVRQRHRGGRLPEAVPRRVPDQGQPAARGRGGNPRRGRGIPFRAGVRQQAGTLRGAGGAPRPGKRHHLQRLQGRRVHPERAAGPQAGQADHHGRREDRGAAPDRGDFPGDGRRAAGRPPRAAAERARASGRRAAARTRSSACPRRNSSRRANILKANGSGALPASWCISTSAARCPTSARSSAPCARRRGFTRSSRRWATSSNTWTWAAAWASITTARARRSIQHELHAAGVRARHRLQHHGRVRLGEGAAPDHRQRERPGARGASFDAGRRGVRRHREGRRARAIEVTEKDAKLVQDISETQKGLSAARTGSKPCTTR